MSKINLICAMDDMGGIGWKGKLPWNIPDDLKFFHETTAGQIVIMGYFTWMSLPNKPLPNRINFVLTHSLDLRYSKYNSNVCFLDNIHDILGRCECDYPNKHIFIIGGRQIYELALSNNLVDQMIITKIHGIFQTDIRFPWPEQASQIKWDRQTIEQNVIYDRYIYTKAK